MMSGEDYEQTKTKTLKLIKKKKKNEISFFFLIKLVGNSSQSNLFNPEVPKMLYIGSKHNSEMVRGRVTEWHPALRS